jgi:hypothetical protein
MTKILFLIALLNVSCYSYSQSTLPTEQELKTRLKEYLETKKEVSDGDSSIIYVVNLLDYDPYHQEIGIYKFGVLGPHYLPYIALITEGEIKITKDYKVEEVLRLIPDFMERYDSKYSEMEKIKLVQNVLQVLEIRSNMIEDSSISDEIEY